LSTKTKQLTITTTTYTKTNRDHLNILASDGAEQELDQKLAIVHKLKTMPIAIATDDANEQHYEVPAKFYDLCLGPRKKYSSGLWPSPSTTFEESEIAMLEKYCVHAGIKDGMNIVDLGCGWGSLTLHLAENVSSGVKYIVGVIVSEFMIFFLGGGGDKAIARFAYDLILLFLLILVFVCRFKKNTVSQRQDHRYFQQQLPARIHFVDRQGPGIQRRQHHHRYLQRGGR
jgi:hypothetical protein